MSTPRTDAQAGWAIANQYGQSTASELLGATDGVFVHAVFARTLERELTTLTAERDQLRAALALGQINCDNAYNDLRTERDELRAEAAKERARVRVLREALKKYRQTVIIGGSNPARDALAGTEGAK